MYRFITEINESALFRSYPPLTDTSGSSENETQLQVSLPAIPFTTKEIRKW